MTKIPPLAPHPLEKGEKGRLLKGRGRNLARTIKTACYGAVKSLRGQKMTAGVRWGKAELDGKIDWHDMQQ